MKFYFLHRKIMRYYDNAEQGIVIVKQYNLFVILV